MQKLLTTLFFSVLFSIQLFAASSSANLGTLVINSNTEMTVSVLVDAKSDKKNKFRFSVSNRSGYDYYFQTKTKSKDAIVEALNKYLEWEEIATAEGVTVQKEIKKILIDPFWEYLASWYIGWPTHVKPAIRSIDINTHLLVMSFRSVAPITNKSYAVMFNPDDLSLTRDQVLQLLAIISPENINEKTSQVRENLAAAKQNDASKSDIFK